MSTATEMCLRDHNSNNCTRSGNVCCCTYVVNNDYDKFRSFSRLYMTLFRHRTCTYLHGRADRFLVSVSNGQVAALSDWAYYHLGFGAVYLGETSRLRFLRDSDWETKCLQDVRVCLQEPVGSATYWRWREAMRFGCGPNWRRAARGSYRCRETREPRAARSRRPPGGDLWSLTSRPIPSQHEKKKKNYDLLAKNVAGISIGSAVSNLYTFWISSATWWCRWRHLAASAGTSRRRCADFSARCVRAYGDACMRASGIGNRESGTERGGKGSFRDAPMQLRPAVWRSGRPAVRPSGRPAVRRVWNRTVDAARPTADRRRPLRCDWWTAKTAGIPTKKHVLLEHSARWVRLSFASKT